ATNAVLHEQIALVQHSGARGRQLLRDVDAYLAGVNAYNKRHGDYAAKWTREDVVAVGTLVGANFGAGGGDEVRRAEFLSALQQRLGEAKGRAVFDDLRELQDPEAPVSVPGTFAYGSPSSGAGNAEIDAGSFQPWGGAGSTSYRSTPHASNAILVAGSRSSTHHPLFLAGPQVGYLFPEYLLELDLHGGGLDARGVAFPGLSFYLQIGRGRDYAWSATSAGSDVIDQFAERLCGGDDTHYLYKGDCRAMETFDAGLLKGKGGEPDRELIFRKTVHGPVLGYATSHGIRVAIASARSTRGRELLAAVPFQVLTTNGVHSARDFVATMNTFELTFNWFYADDRDIAMVSSGRLPLRAPGVDMGLPTAGGGESDWRGFAGAAVHVHSIDPAGGAIVNWNNKPGLGFASADANWSYGSIQRVQLLQRGVAARRVHTPASLVSAMNRAATQDLRAVELVPTLAEVLHSGPAPSARDARLLDLLEAWRAAGGSRLDRDGDGKIDDPGAAIMDAAWPRLADAVLAPVLGPLTEQLATLMQRNQNANSNGSAYADGWYGYVDKDLRSVLGKPVTGAFNVRYCGGGDLTACRASLWAALDAAGNELAAAQGADPAAWHADAVGERIDFGLLPDTMRWANRPTFQQLVSFGSHRPGR
ncbi:MAG: hypothetical protein QOE36_2926, partial [Gaiellaceae bacterium]|nr:hypothetical protein [Gaiellaceae bacterium]